MSLVEKYRPRRLEDLVGLPHVKSGIRNFLEDPYASGWLFYGDSGTGKNTVVTIISEALNTKPLHLIGESCNYDKLTNLLRELEFKPGPLDIVDIGRPRPDFHLVCIDEVDSAKETALRQMYPLFDSMGRRDNAIVIFTTNNIKKLEDRFTSRCKKLQFGMWGDCGELEEFLSHIFRNEGIAGKEPRWKDVIAENKRNARACVNYIDDELGIRGRVPSFIGPKANCEVMTFRKVPGK